MTPKRLVPLVLIIIIVIATILAASLTVQARPLAQTGWQELSRAERSGDHIWKHVNYRAYNGACGQFFCSYMPHAGPNAYWWTESFDPTQSGGWGAASSGWYNDWPTWGYHPVPGFGNRAFGGNCAGYHCANHITSLMRTTFIVPPGYTVTDARIQVFGDNNNHWYLNGIAVSLGGHWAEASVPADLFHLNGEENVLAAVVYNDGACHGCNPHGMHYILEAQLQPAVTINVRNPQGAPLIRAMHGSAHDIGFWGVINQLQEFWGHFSSHTAAPPEPNGRSYVGGYVEMAGNEQFMPGQSTINSSGMLGLGLFNWTDVYCAWDATTFSSGECTVVLATPTPSPTPTSTNTPTPTAIPTSTPTPTNTPTPIPTATPYPGGLTVEHPWVVWYAPDVGEETQVIRGTRFLPNEMVEIRVIGPPDVDGDGNVCGQQTTYTVQADAAGELALDATESGDPYFGTQCKGAWQAQATGQDTGLDTNAVNWSVAWFPARRDR